MPVEPQGSGYPNLQAVQFSQAEMADLFVAYLKQLQIDYIFGLPGGAIEPLFNALARSERSGGTRMIVSRHESGAAFMAHAYFTNSNKLGVCCATTGPGATNLVTGVTCAFQNNVPMLVVTAQTAMRHFGRGAFQDSSDTSLDVVRMFECCTGYSTLISHAEQFEHKLVAAILSAYQTQTPSHISVPIDIMRSPALTAVPAYELGKLLNVVTLVDKNAVEQLYQLLSKHNNIVFLIGEGCSEGVGFILSVALAVQASVITTPGGKGFVSPFHPLFKGVFGMGGHKSATELLNDPKLEVVVAIGTVLSEWSTNGWDVALINNKLVHVEEKESHFMRSPMAQLHVRGNIKTVFEILQQKLKASTTFATFFDNQAKDVTTDKVESIRERRQRLIQEFKVGEEQACYSSAVPIKPQRVMTDLTALFPPSTVYLADTGNSMTWAVHYLHPYDRRLSGNRSAKGGVFQIAMEFATMGWAIGAAIGVALAKPDNPVVAIIGDGSWLMNGQEITVAKQEKLTVIFVIFNDGALGMVKHGQRLTRAEPIGYELPQIDYCQWAASMDIDGYRINTPEDLARLDVDKIIKRKEPVLLDVRIDPEEVPPMMTRIKILNGVQNDRKGA